MFCINLLFLLIKIGLILLKKKSFFTKHLKVMPFSVISSNEVRTITLSVKVLSALDKSLWVFGVTLDCNIFKSLHFNLRLIKSDTCYELYPNLNSSHIFPSYRAKENHSK